MNNFIDFLVETLVFILVLVISIIISFTIGYTLFNIHQHVYVHNDKVYFVQTQGGINADYNNRKK